MKAHTVYPKVLSVTPLTSKRLLVKFSSGPTKTYNCKPLLKEDVFSPLKNETFFRSAHADKHGYGVIWNDEIDLSESELWLHGKTATESDDRK